jgi:hypothetical protein
MCGMETGHKSILTYDVKPYVIYYYPYRFRPFRKIVKSDYEHRHVHPSVPLPAWNNPAPTGQILLKFTV